MDPLTGAKDILLPKLLELLGGDCKLKKKVKKDLIFLNDELTSIQEWTREARDLSYDIEHVVLKFWARQFRPADQPAGLNGFLAKVTFKPATPSARRKFASEINGFKGRLTNLAMPHSISRSISVADELVGIADRVEDLVTKIPAEEAGSTSNRQLKVVSIHGPPGVGKTTLANQVYRKLRPRFDCAAFVSMSTTLDIKKVLWDMLTQISRQDDAKFGTINVGETISEITKALQNKRCFIVFDDVRDIKAWETIKSALIGKGKGSSAVLTTTCSDDIAADVGGRYPLAPLPEHFSRELFYSRLFGSEEKCPPKLAEICTAMRRKCSDIPSDIIRATSLLAATEEKDWQAVLDTYTGVAAPAVQPGVVAVAAPRHGQSLATVPPYLKPCLLYLSMFEKGCKISVDRLLWEWIAEGFVPMKNRKQGEEYLRDLIERNFIEAVEVDFGGNALSCRVHDEVHDSIVKFTSEEKSVTILDGQQEPPPESVRRLSIQGNIPPPTGMPLPQVRSLVVSGDNLSFEEDCGDNLMPYLSKLENVRVLDLWGCRSLQNDHLTAVGRLVLLTCLVVRGDYITHIPEGIGSLVFLQTLDLRATSVKELPVSIVRAIQLKCLRVNGHTKIPHGIGKLEALEELGDINISEPKLLKELCSLTGLMILGIAVWSWDESYDEALLDYLSFLEKRNIQSLSILTCCSLDFLKDLHKEWDPPGLRKIEIRHITFHKLPGWISSVKNLSSLSIELYKLSDDIVGMLGKLQNLRKLSLTSKHAPQGELFGSSTQGFSKLTSFHFASSAMRKIFGLGAMRKLERIKLSFHVLPTKEVSPSFDFGLDYLFSLKHVHVEIICVNASPRVVEEAEAAIDNAIRSGANVQKERVGKEEMLKNEEEEVGQVCSQVAYFDLIQTFNLEQRRAIEEIGFGELLKMKRVKIRHELCKSLADVYDIKSEAFNIGGSMLKISIEDVDHLMGLPSEGEEIVEAPKTKKTGLFSLCKGKKGTTVCLDTLLDYFRKNKGHDEDFIGTILLYTIGVLICPTEHRHVSSDYLNLVEKVEEIKTVNWASLTLHHLKASIKKYKTAKTNLGGNSVQNLEGNLALLQLWYWEKFYVNNLDYSGRERPLLQYWDEEKASKREKYKLGEGKTVEDIRSPDNYKQSSESANKMDEVGGLLTQLMIDNMHHQLQLLNHDSKVREMLRDIRLNDAETRMLIQEARDRAEDLMKQVLDVGCGPSDKSGIVERFYNLRKSCGQHKRSPHGTNSTIGKSVRKPAGAESTSMFGKPNATVGKTPQMEHHETHNVSEGKGEEVEDNQYDFEVKSLKPIKAPAVKVKEVVPGDMTGYSSKYAEPTKPLASVEIRHLSLAQRARDFILSDAVQEKYEGVNLICMLDLKKCQMNWTTKNLKDMYMTNGWLDCENIDQIIKYWKKDTKRQHLFQSGERVLVPAQTCMYTLLVDEHNKDTTFNLDDAVPFFESFVTEDLTKAKLIFIPTIHKNHWTLYVLNRYNNSLDILDSMEYHGDISRRDSYHSERTKMMKRLDQILKKIYPTMSWLNWENMAKSVKYVDTPKQIFSDCAFFVLKFMEWYDGKKLVLVPDPSKIEEMRAEYLYLMLFHPDNKKRGDLPKELKDLAPDSD